MAAMDIVAVTRTAYDAGFRYGKGLVIAVAVAGAESSLDPAAEHHNTDGSTDLGLWQINSVHQIAGDLTDPAVNATSAFGISKQGTDFAAWVAYRSGAYRTWLPLAQLARRVLQEQLKIETAVEALQWSPPTS